MPAWRGPCFAGFGRRGSRLYVRTRVSFFTITIAIDTFLVHKSVVDMASSDQSDGSSVNALSRTVCALCRQRKTRCDRKLPKCSFCIKAKVECSYLPRPKKRGLRAGYVTELESRIGKSHDFYKIPKPLTN